MKLLSKLKPDLKTELKPENSTSLESETSLLQRLSQKILCSVKSLGQELLDQVLVLYFAYIDSDTPTWAKLVIAASIAYFIAPIDAIPDMLPTGYVDDLSTLLAAFSSVKAHVKESHYTRAEALKNKLLTKAKRQSL